MNIHCIIMSVSMFIEILLSCIHYPCQTSMFTYFICLFICIIYDLNIAWYPKSIL